MKQGFLGQFALISLFFVFSIRPAEASSGLLEKLRQDNLSLDGQQEIAENLRSFDEGMEFFLTDDIDTYVPKTVQKTVLKKMIERSQGSFFGGMKEYSIPQRRKAGDQIIPLVDSAAEVAAIFLWDNKRATGSLIVDSPLSEEQMRVLVQRGRINSLSEAIKLLASRPANFPADQLPYIVESLLPYIQSVSNGASIFNERGATSFEEGTTNVPRAPVGREVREAYRLPQSLITDIVNATLPHIETAGDMAFFLSPIISKHPKYPLTELLDYTLSLIETAEDGISFLNVNIVRGLSKTNELGRVIRHIVPLMTSKIQVKIILDRTRDYKGSGKYHNYLSEEDVKYLIDNTAHLFSPIIDWKINDALEELPLNRKERRYAKKVWKNYSRGEEGLTASGGASLLEKIMGCLPKFKNK